MLLSRALSASLLAITMVAMTACGGGGGGGAPSDGGGGVGGGDGGGSGGGVGGGDGNGQQPIPEPPPIPVAHAIMFVGQTPLPTGGSDFAVVTGTFGNHRGTTYAAPRGGSLYIRYEDGEVVDLVDKAFKASCGMPAPAVCDARGSRVIDSNGVLTHGVAVRTPSVHWNGSKVLFSMSVGAPLESEIYKFKEYFWQIYEIDGIGQDETPIIRKIPGQFANRNNVDAIYGSDPDEIFFATDEPITRDPKHYPQLDEYESTATVSGLWKLNLATGVHTVVDHAPSGAFDPFIDQAGKLIYTRWDHMQADQQASNATYKAFHTSYDDPFKAFTYDDENDVGEAARESVLNRTTRLLEQAVPDPVEAFNAGEPVIPEVHATNPFYVDSNPGSVIGTVGGVEYKTTIAKDAHGRKYLAHFFNTFMPWQLNQDGTGHETLRHIGRQELLSYMPQNFINDGNLSGRSNPEQVFPFNISENPNQPGMYIANTAGEFGSHRSGRIVTLTDTIANNEENGDGIQVKQLTRANSDFGYRDPIMLADGRMIASADQVPYSVKGSKLGFNVFDFQLRELVPDKVDAGDTAGFVKGSDTPVVPSIQLTFKYYENQDGRAYDFDGRLWMLDAQEVITRPRPPLTTFKPLASQESQMLQSHGVSETALRNYLKNNKLALLVSRNVTSRDEADKQQPFHLEIDRPGGTFTQGNGPCVPVENGSCRYKVKYMQFFENKLLRGYERFSKGTGANYKDNGRRGLARPMDFPEAVDANPPLPATSPESSVLLGADGSMAAIVPAERAMTWAMEDLDGNPIVRERVWLTFKSGEIRVCTSCHGVNDKNQAGQPSPQNAPQALGALMDYLKAEGKL